MEEIRGLFKETFHAKMGTIKDGNDKGLIKGDEIKKGWQEYIEKLYLKGLNDLENHDGVITHLEAEIIEYEVK